MDTGSVCGEQTGQNVNRRKRHLETETGGVVCVTGGWMYSDPGPFYSI